MDISFPRPSDDSYTRFFFSAFTLIIPFICFNRPPRTVISSVQSQQATSVPFGAGTSSVAPTHVSKPLVSTQLAESIINSGTAGIPDNIPGEDLVIGYASFNDTYEDQIMMSAGSASRGLFEHLAYTAYNLKSGEDVPAQGERVRMKDNPWWKTYSRRQIDTLAYAKRANVKSVREVVTPDGGKKKEVKILRPYIAGGSGEGRVISKGITQSGELSVKVLRHATPVSGDKLASGHGQKGVIKIVEDADMPWGVDENCECIRFDIIMSVASIVNRQTNGHYFELVTGVDAAGEGRRIVVSPSQECYTDKETPLYSGESGEMITRCSEDGDVPVLASWGIARTWAMTQLSFDKQHYPHDTTGISSINVPTGRSKGGRIKISEMSFNAMLETGPKGIMNEMNKKMRTIDTGICIRCESALQICMCDSRREVRNVSIPQPALVFDYANILVNGYHTVYKLSF